MSPGRLATFVRLSPIELYTVFLKLALSQDIPGYSLTYEDDDGSFDALFDTKYAQMPYTLLALLNTDSKGDLPLALLPDFFVARVAVDRLHRDQPVSLVVLVPRLRRMESRSSRVDRERARWVMRDEKNMDG
ncbi:hypothetical protein B0H11DRAFT_1929498 [Mycena galericulata]|nr:hypothetical protein B0H11DRAFT_1929498 [Mycena galericulata]